MSFQLPQLDPNFGWMSGATAPEGCVHAVTNAFPEPIGRRRRASSYKARHHL